MPVLLTPGGEDAWDETRGRIGWLGFEQVRDSVSPGEGYTRAVATMLPTLVPSVTTTTAETGEPLITENFARFSEATVRLAGEIEELARLSFGERSVERGSGSSSVTIAGQVRLKVIPSDPGGEEHVVLGIRATLSPQDWCPHRLAGPRLIGVGDRRRGFFLLEPVGGAEESLRVAAEVFELLAQRFPAGERA
jgi:hypothetical protein